MPRGGWPATGDLEGPAPKDRRVGGYYIGPCEAIGPNPTPGSNNRRGTFLGLARLGRSLRGVGTGIGQAGRYSGGVGG